MENKYASIDILRAMACCMVLTVHCCECYYISNFYSTGDVAALDIEAWRGEAFWACIIGAVCRTCVPLFVMISGFLLLPMKSGMDTTSFYKKRAVRILIPLLLWTVVYAFYTAIHFGVQFSGAGDAMWYIVKEIGYVAVNFPPAIGHLWYVYMILGLYLFIPIISPWVERATKRDMRIFLGIWLLTMMVPFIHKIWPEIWGECYWNPNSTIYYFSGFIGYLIAGAYARKYLMEDGKSYFWTGLAMFIIGYAGTLGGVLYQLNNLVPTAENYGSYMPEFEFSWQFGIISVGLETLGLFLMIFKCRPQKLPWIVGDYSKLSYGVYLCHIMFLTWFYDHIFVSLAWPTPVKIVSMAAMTIVTSYAVVKILSYVPKLKNWIG